MEKEEEFCLCYKNAKTGKMTAKIMTFGIRELLHFCMMLNSNNELSSNISIINYGSFKDFKISFNYFTDTLTINN